MSRAGGRADTPMVALDMLLLMLMDLNIISDDMYWNIGTDDYAQYVKRINGVL